MARYRKITSLTGSFFDKLTDQVQITLWFAAVGYAAYAESQNVLPIFLAFVGVAFYNLRGYIKYVSLYTQISNDSHYCDTLSKQASSNPTKLTAGLGFGILANLRWFVCEQRKIVLFDEGVFVFILSLALILDKLTPMLWIFAISQLYYALLRSWQQSYQITHNQQSEIKK